MSETRARIVTATNELFRIHGYHGTSVSQISQVAGATTGSIYHFFPGGKDELTVVVIEETAAAYRQLFELIADAADDVPSAFVDFFHGAAEVLVDNDYIDPCPIGTIAREVASTNDPLRTAAGAAFDSWVGAATEFLIASGLAVGEARELALVFVATVEGSFVVSRTLRSPEPLHAAAATFGSVVAQAHERNAVS